MGRNMISINSLTKKINNKTVLNNISLSVAKGNVLGLLGLNGAGKSTTIKTILGFIKPTSGSVEVGTNSIGYLPENPYYYDHLTLSELLDFALKSSNTHVVSPKQRIKHYAQLVGMEECIDKKIRMFSKGMVQRAGLAAALIHEPELVVLDEPMSGLDPLGRKMVFNLVSKLKNDGVTVLFCSHILNDAERLCDNIAIMDKGEIILKLSQEELMMTSSRVEVLLRKTSNLLVELEGYDYKEYESNLGVFVISEKLSQFIETMNHKEFTVIAIRPSSGTLEDIFTQVVGKGA
jgi:ABC-2 type transport system ATP-binding protein